MSEEVPSTHGYFRSFDGTKLYYSSIGPQDAPALLFCYGLVCSRLQWKYQIEHFKFKYRVIYLDYRGHGKSDNPKDASSMTIENFAKDIKAIHDELNIKPLSILGHSLGVNIILEFYRLYPELVRSLVLASGTPKDPFETMFHHNFLQIFYPIFNITNKYLPEVADKLWKMQGKNPINKEVVARLGFNLKYANRKDINEYIETTSKVRFDLFLNLLNDFTGYDACYWLDQIKAPTLVIGGEKDLITPLPMQKTMHRLIPKSLMKVIPEGSHCPQMEHVDLVNKELESFFKKIK